MSHSTRRHCPPAAHQQGAALAIALILLVIITLLGLAAVRSTQTGLRMARNAEARALAQQSAEAMVSRVLEDTAGNYLPVNNDAGFKACSPLAALTTLPLVVSGGHNTVCTGFTVTGLKPPDSEKQLQEHGYVVVTRELPLFSESASLRSVGNSGRGYDFARYKVVGGFDRSADAAGVAEITEVRLVPHVKDALLGVNYQ